MTLAEATARIEAVNLKVGKVTKAFNEKVPEGQVVSAKPGPGASLKKGTAVALDGEQGPQADRRARPHRQGRQNAARELSGLGLKVDATEQENSDTVPKGRVSARARATAPLFRGDTVTLVVSKGPVLVEVPERRRPAAAAGPRHPRGRRVHGRRCARRSAASSARCGCRTPPAAEAPKGSTVTLTIV